MTQQLIQEPLLGADRAAELEQLRKRLLRMIVENETTRRPDARELRRDSSHHESNA